MQPPTFRGKPSEAHLIWRRSGAGAEAEKRFDEETLRAWCSRYGVEFETGKRVDHDRSDRPRAQYRCIFAWEESAGESFDMGDDEWEIAAQKTPRTFLEIDSAGEARLKGWSEEHVLDIEELWHDGAALVFRAAELDGTKRLRVEKLTSRPE